MIVPSKLRISLVGILVGSLTPLLIYKTYQEIPYYSKYFTATASEVVATNVSLAGKETFLETPKKEAPNAVEKVVENTPIIQQNDNNYKNYLDYPVKPYTDKLNIPKELSKNKVKSPNFAGHYYISGINCNKSEVCAGYKIYDLSSGKSLGDIQFTDDKINIQNILLKYQYYSNLLIVQIFNTNHDCKQQYFVYNVEKFIPISKPFECELD